MIKSPLPKLRLEVFREHNKRSAKWPAWAKFLWLAFLYWLEGLYIDQKVREELRKAEREAQERLEGASMSVPLSQAPEYTERFTEACESLPEMRLKAPWLKDNRNQ